MPHLIPPPREWTARVMANGKACAIYATVARPRGKVGIAQSLFEDFWFELDGTHPHDVSVLQGFFDNVVKDGTRCLQRHQYKHLKNGNYEFRSGTVRIGAFEDDRGNVYLSHGWFKATEKTEHVDIGLLNCVRSDVTLALNQKTLLVEE